MSLFSYMQKSWFSHDMAHITFLFHPKCPLEFDFTVHYPNNYFNISFVLGTMNPFEISLRRQASILNKLLKLLFKSCVRSF